MVLSTLLSQLQMVGQKHTSKDYVPQFAVSSKLWRARFRVTAEELFFGTVPKTIKTSSYPPTTTGTAARTAREPGTSLSDEPRDFGARTVSLALAHAMRETRKVMVI